MGKAFQVEKECKGEKVNGNEFCSTRGGNKQIHHSTRNTGCQGDKRREMEKRICVEVKRKKMKSTNE